MRKSISYLVTIISTVLIVYGLFSCNMDVGVKTPENETKATGKITGKVMYSNVEGDAHNGIILTLDKTDGLVTQNVMNVMQGRVQTVDIFQNGDSNARVIVANNVTSSNGSYTFENLAEGTYTVYAASSYSAEKAVCTNVVVRAAETSVADILRLTATGSITGRITLDNGTSGNTGFLVFVAGTSYMAMTDDAGNYTITGVPAGNGYQVVATKNGVIHNLSSNVTVTANGSAALADNNFTSSEIDNTVQGEKGETGAAGVDGKDGISMVWLGAFDSADEIENPVYLNAYFNMTDGCSYIYNGSYWELLARSGANGKDGTDGREINWLGSYNDEEELYASCSYYSEEEEEYHAYIPQYLDAYFNKTNGCSYIYKNGWQLLAKSGAAGADGKSINWRGYYSSEYEINNPEELDVYFNDTDGCSYIYIEGYWRILAQRGEKGTDGTNGKGINWLGSYQSEELLYEDNSYTYTDDDDNYYTITFTPQYLDAYYNEIDGCSYIYYGCWTLLAKGGNGIKWLGSYSSVSEIDNPKEFDAFFNYTTGCSYIYTEYDGWTLLASKGASGENGRDGTDGNDGENGKSFRWRGSYSSSDNISTPQFMDVYHNTTDGCSYIFDGSNWQLLASKGDTGAAGRDGNDGKDGENGKSIKWLGSYSSLAALYEAYGHYDPVEGFWYYNPKYLDAYYNTTDGCSYIYVYDSDSYSWCLLASKGDKGDTGENGKSINWLGSYTSSTFISDPQILDAYFNSEDGCSYIYTSNGWQLLAQKGESGKSINWRGSFSSSSNISNPQYLDAYYDETDGCSYIFNGTGWKLLASKGENGKSGNEGKGINWRGAYSYEEELDNPQYLDAYYNMTDGCSYIYNGDDWTLLTKSGSIGKFKKMVMDFDDVISFPIKTTITEVQSTILSLTNNTTLKFNGKIDWNMLYAIVESMTTNNTVYIALDFSNTTGITEWYNWFSEVQTLYAISLPNTIKNIERYAFYKCTNLRSIILPENVSSIGYWAFTDCSKLEYINYTGKPEQWLEISFSDESSNPLSYTHHLYINGQELSEIKIPDGISRIKEYTFYGCVGLTSITIPSTVTSIGEKAFYNCSGLTSINIDNGLTKIEDSAFYDCSGLSSITIPNSVTNIGKHAFYGCSSLKSITIPDSVTSIGDYVFYDCSALTSITIPDSVTSIGMFAFYGCSNITNITIPDSVTSIGIYAFYGCRGLTSITIPDSVINIGECAFSNCYELTSIIGFTNCSSFTYELHKYEKLTNIVIGKGVTCIEEMAFLDCKVLESITIPKSVTSIGANAFFGCSGLKKVNYTGTIEEWIEINFSDNPLIYADHLYINGNKITNIHISDTATRIGDKAFYGYSNLTSITIPDSVTSIGDYVFCDCSGLSSITIPDSVTSIGNWVFHGCSSLTSITIPDKISSIGGYVFYGCSGLTSIEIPDSVTSIGNDAFYGCSGLKDIIIGDGVSTLLGFDFGSYSKPLNVVIGTGITSINNEFAHCTGLTNIIIPDSVTSVGDYAFSSCSSLTSITIPNKVASIGERTFDYCTSLTSITIPDSVTSIGDYAFHGCSSLKSITIPDSVTSIGESTFYSCSSLTNITIPDKVTSIGTSVFSGCTGLTSITIPDSVTSIGNWAFCDCKSLTNITIPDSVMTIGSQAFAGCEKITTIRIPTKIKCIEENTFINCFKLENIMIPDGINIIGDSAFQSCSLLRTITISENVTSIGSNAFYSCNSLTTVYYRGNESQWKEIDIGSANSPLTNATIIYNYTGEATVESGTLEALIY